MELLTNLPGTTTLLECLKHDLGGERPLAGVDIICSYIKKSGVKELRDVFINLLERQVPVRVVTTTSLGISEPEAIKELADFCNVRVKVQYWDAANLLSFYTKGWRFHDKE